MKIGLISDSHGYLGSDTINVLCTCDEIWHAGDIGPMEIIEELESIGPTLRAVYGNIDGGFVRQSFPRDFELEIDGITIFMTHIGGYPPRYVKRVREKLEVLRPDLYICGHSHICKVMPDRILNLLHMNPGAVGHHGFHKVRTMLTFHILDGKITDVQAVELGLRGRKN